MADQVEFVKDFEVFNVGGFGAQIEKLTKRYKVQFTVIPGEVVSRTEENKDGVFDYSVQKMSVVFTVPGYKIKGFHYLGCVKDNDNIGLLSMFGADLLESLNASEFIKSLDTIPCHNCNRKHIRKIGHLFQVEETGELIVFGSSCAKNYFGIDFTKLLSMFERVELGIESWDEESRGNHFSSIVDFEKVSKLAYYVIGSDKFHPYTSNAQASDKGIMSTSDIVKDAVSRPAEFQKMIALDSEFWNSIDINFSDIAGYSFTDKTENLTTFEHNIQTIQEKIRLNCVGTQDVGLLVWMINKIYFMAKKESVDYTLPGYSVGEKIVGIPVTLAGVHEYENQYGLQKIYTLISGTVRYKWFTSVCIQNKIEGVGIDSKLILVSATIKELEDSPKYGKSVIITRAKIEGI